MSKIGRRRDADFDSMLEAWAGWLVTSAAGEEAAPRSMLARWMDAKGQLLFGGGIGGVPIDTVETRIEDCVCDMGRENPLREDVLRLEYAAGWWTVVCRHELRGYDPRGMTQLQNALHLGVGVATYRRRLAEARAYVAKRLGKTA